MRGVLVTEYGDASVLRLTDLPLPEPAGDEVRIRVVATSVNFADIKARQGRYHGRTSLPFVPGIDLAGVVDKVGADIHDLEMDQPVVAFVAHGSYSEFVAVRRQRVFALPQGVTWATAAAMPTVSATAYELLSRVTRLQRGESVLVHAGAGGVGLAALQVAKHLGARRVVATAGSPAKLEMARRFGADVAIDYTERSFVEAVLDATEQQGVDVILDAVGGERFSGNLACLTPFGRLAVFGNAAGSYGSVSGGDLHGSCRSVLGYSLGTTLASRPESVRASVEAVLRLAAQGTLRMHVSRTFPLAEVGEAHKELESGRSTGKILLRVSPDMAE